MVNSIDLSGLTSEERDKVKLLISECNDVFSIGNNDVGNIQVHPMKINQYEYIPVKVT